MTDVIRVSPENPDPVSIARAAECLRAGGLVAFPTETVYGLGVNALDRTAVQRLFTAKQRPATDPLIVHIGSIESLPALVARVPASVATLADRFWPGPLTLVLSRSEAVPDEVTAGLNTVAIRIPLHPVARALISAAAIPVAAPSANLFSRPSPTQASHVLDDLDGRIDLVVDGGATTIGVESTVLDLTSEIPIVLRPGAVTLEMLRDALGNVRVFPETGRNVSTDASAAMMSPGMLEKHYSPRASLTLYEGETTAVLPALVGTAHKELANGRSVAIIAVEEDANGLAALALDQRVLLRTLGSQDAPATIARTLYATFRELDASGVDVILVRGFPAVGLGTAVQDRLRRAAAGRIVRL